MPENDLCLAQAIAALDRNISTLSKVHLAQNFVSVTFQR
jgi:hypothetical protein